MDSNKSSGKGLTNWWQNRIIRTKILVGIFIGVFIFQGVSTTYEMQQVENDILATYNEKALNLSVAIDCIVLKDGILFFNLLDRIGRTEVVGMKIDDDHPSCVEREEFLQRLEGSFFNKFEQQQAKVNPQATAPQVAAAAVGAQGEEIEVVEEIEDVPVESGETTIPLNLIFDAEGLIGDMESTNIVINGEDKSQLLYTVKVNGVQITFDLTDLPARKLDRFIALTTNALGNLAVLFIIIWLMAGQIVEPLKKLTNFTQRVMESGSIQKGEEVDLVQSPAKDEIGILTRAFNQMISQLQKSYRQIIKSKAAIGDLLDNTGQGFFSFGPDYVINDEYSKACEAFFQHEIQGRDALDLMVAEKKEKVKELMDLLFDGVGDLKLLEDLLPGELDLHGRILDMDYRFIKATSKEISDKMMVILTDVTQERQLARQLEKDERINELIVRIARDKDGFIQFVQETDNFLIQTVDDLKKNGGPLDSNTLLRQFHTLKGGSASFGLFDFSEKAHELEDQILEASKEEKLDDATLIKEICEQINSMIYVLRNSLDHVQDIVTWEEIDQSRSRVYRIPKEKLERLEQLVDQKGKLTVTEIKSLIEEMKKQPIKPVLKKYATSASKLADKLGKQVSIITRGTDVEVPFDRLNPLFDTLVHLVRNSVDHGLEDPDTRKMLGKPEEGSLIIEAKQENSKYKLLISDDGSGIDPGKIKKIAIEKGLITDSQSQDLTDDDSVKLIFKPGFSTADSVSNISGRGVGLDAVKTVLKDLGGSISIRTAIDKGTSFVLSIPA